MAKLTLTAPLLPPVLTTLTVTDPAACITVADAEATPSVPGTGTTGTALDAAPPHPLSPIASIIAPAIAAARTPTNIRIPIQLTRRSPAILSHPAHAWRSLTHAHDTSHPEPLSKK